MTGSRNFFRCFIGRQRRAPSGTTAEAGLIVVAEPRSKTRPQAVGSDQRDGALLAHHVAAHDLYGQAMGVVGKIIDLLAEPHVDVRIDLRCFEQSGLQVGAIAPANRARHSGIRLPRRAACGRSRGRFRRFSPIRPRGRPRDPSAARRRRARAGYGSRSVRAECRRRSLAAFGLFEDERAESVMRERKRGGQSADTGRPRR